MSFPPLAGNNKSLGIFFLDIFIFFFGLGGFRLLWETTFQSISLNQSWALISAEPNGPDPNLLEGSLSRS